MSTEIKNTGKNTPLTPDPNKRTQTDREQKDQNNQKDLQREKRRDDEDFEEKELKGKEKR